MRLPLLRPVDVHGVRPAFSAKVVAVARRSLQRPGGRGHGVRTPRRRLPDHLDRVETRHAETSTARARSLRVANAGRTGLHDQGRTGSRTHARVRTRARGRGRRAEASRPVGPCFRDPRRVDSVAGATSDHDVHRRRRPRGPAAPSPVGAASEQVPLRIDEPFHRARRRALVPDDRQDTRRRLASAEAARSRARKDAPRRARPLRRRAVARRLRDLRARRPNRRRLRAPARRRPCESARLRLPGCDGKIPEKVCRCGGHVPIRGSWRASRPAAAIRPVPGGSGTLGTCGSSNVSNETRRG